MSNKWLHLHLAAPLMSYGGLKIDHVGETREFPSLSALTGLIANAFGWSRHEHVLLQSLQDKIIFGALSVNPEGYNHELKLRDMQNAKIEKSDKAWTTYGRIFERSGDSYNSPHRLSRDYLADHQTHVVLRLRHTLEDENISIEQVAHAFEYPLRPLFIGRKSCLPSTLMFTNSWVNGENSYEALRNLNLKGKALWSDDSPSVDGSFGYEMMDLRHWKNGYHTGSRVVNIGLIE